MCSFIANVQNTLKLAGNHTEFIVVFKQIYLSFVQLLSFLKWSYIVIEDDDSWPEFVLFWGRSEFDGAAGKKCLGEVKRTEGLRTLTSTSD